MEPAMGDRGEDAVKPEHESEPTGLSCQQEENRLCSPPGWSRLPAAATPSRPAPHALLPSSSTADAKSHLWFKNKTKQTNHQSAPPASARSPSQFLCTGAVLSMGPQGGCYNLGKEQTEPVR